MKPTLLKILLGGSAGTFVMSLMMQFMAPMMLGRPMDIAALLSKMIGSAYVVGVGIHILLGVVVFPLIYFALVPRFLPGPPLVKGLVFGFVLWLLAATVVMPMAGAGFFMSEIGGIKAAIAALLGHLVYGGLLGTITNEDRNWNLKPALHQHYNGVNPLEEGLNK